MHSEAALPAILALEAVILLTLWVFLYQLMKQQGRLLLRLDGLQRQVTDKQIAALTGSNAAAAAPNGLRPGTAITPFSLPDLTGQTVDLESFKGKRVLLVHWSPGCGFCAKIAPALAELLPDLEKHQVQLLFVSYGDVESNHKLAEKHGLTCPILLVQEGSKAPDMFQNFGTPVAYLLDEQGLVLAPIAVGADQVPALAKEAALGRLRGTALRPALRRRPSLFPISMGERFHWKTIGEGRCCWSSAIPTAALVTKLRPNLPSCTGSIGTTDWR
jgi:peroxiredoxin